MREHRNGGVSAETLERARQFQRELDRWRRGSLVLNYVGPNNLFDPDIILRVAEANNGWEPGLRIPSPPSGLIVQVSPNGEDVHRALQYLKWMGALDVSEQYGIEIDHDYIQTLTQFRMRDAHVWIWLKVAIFVSQLMLISMVIVTVGSTLLSYISRIWTRKSEGRDSKWSTNKSLVKLFLIWGLYILFLIFFYSDALIGYILSPLVLLLAYFPSVFSFRIESFYKGDSRPSWVRHHFWEDFYQGSIVLFSILLLWGIGSLVLSPAIWTFPHNFFISLFNFLFYFSWIALLALSFISVLPELSQPKRMIMSWLRGLRRPGKIGWPALQKFIGVMAVLSFVGIFLLIPYGIDLFPAAHLPDFQAGLNLYYRDVILYLFPWSHSLIYIHIGLLFLAFWGTAAYRIVPKLLRLLGSLPFSVWAWFGLSANDPIRKEIYMATSGNLWARIVMIHFLRKMSWSKKGRAYLQSPEAPRRFRELARSLSLNRKVWKVIGVISTFDARRAVQTYEFFQEFTPSWFSAFVEVFPQLVSYSDFRSNNLLSYLIRSRLPVPENFDRYINFWRWSLEHGRNMINLEWEFHGPENLERRAQLRSLILGLGEESEMRSRESIEKQSYSVEAPLSRLASHRYQSQSGNEIYRMSMGDYDRAANETGVSASTVEYGQNYVRTAINSLSGTRHIWIREWLQNILDEARRYRDDNGGAPVHISIFKDKKGRVVVRFQDSFGMTPTIVDNELILPGLSSKPDGSVGKRGVGFLTGLEESTHVLLRTKGQDASGDQRTSHARFTPRRLQNGNPLVVEVDVERTTESEVDESAPGTTLDWVLETEEADFVLNDLKMEVQRHAGYIDPQLMPVYVNGDQANQPQEELSRVESKAPNGGEIRFVLSYEPAAVVQRSLYVPENPWTLLSPIFRSIRDVMKENNILVEIPHQEELTWGRDGLVGMDQFVGEENPVQRAALQRGSLEAILRLYLSGRIKLSMIPYDLYDLADKRHSSYKDDSNVAKRFAAGEPLPDEEAYREDKGDKVASLLMNYPAIQVDDNGESMMLSLVEILERLDKKELTYRQIIDKRVRRSIRNRMRWQWLGSKLKYVAILSTFVLIYTLLIVSLIHFAVIPMIGFVASWIISWGSWILVLIISGFISWQWYKSTWGGKIPFYGVRSEEKTHTVDPRADTMAFVIEASYQISSLLARQFKIKEADGAPDLYLYQDGNSLARAGAHRWGWNVFLSRSIFYLSSLYLKNRLSRQGEEKLWRTFLSTLAHEFQHIREGSEETQTTHNEAFDRGEAEVLQALLKLLPKLKKIVEEVRKDKKGTLVTPRAYLLSLMARENKSLSSGSGTVPPIVLALDRVFGSRVAQFYIYNAGWLEMTLFGVLPAYLLPMPWALLVVALFGVLHLFGGEAMDEKFGVRPGLRTVLWVMLAHGIIIGLIGILPLWAVAFTPALWVLAGWDHQRRNKRQAIIELISRDPQIFVSDLVPNQLAADQVAGVTNSFNTTLRRLFSDSQQRRQVKDQLNPLFTRTLRQSLTGEESNLTAGTVDHIMESAGPDQAPVLAYHFLDQKDEKSAWKALRRLAARWKTHPNVRMEVVVQNETMAVALRKKVEAEGMTSVHVVSYSAGMDFMSLLEQSVQGNARLDWDWVEKADIRLFVSKGYDLPPSFLDRARNQLSLTRLFVYLLILETLDPIAVEADASRLDLLQLAQKIKIHA